MRETKRETSRETSREVNKRSWETRSWLPRWRYGRRLLWSGRDAWGDVEVVKSPLGATLHFGNSAVQGRLNLDEPWRPVTEYGTTMSAAVAFPAPFKRRITRSPQSPQSSQSPQSTQAPAQPNICLLGLGTGALAWTYYHLLPHAKLTAFELRGAVIEAARAQFKLDELIEQSGLVVQEGDAAHLINELPPRSQTLIAIDLFTSEGMAPALGDPSFWRSVARAIHPIGVVCINAWSGDRAKLKVITQALKRWVVPGGDLLSIDHVEFGNVGLFATPRPIEYAQVCARAARIDERLMGHRPWNPRQQRALRDAGMSGESVRERLERATRR